MSDVALPDGWKQVTLGDVCDVVMGQSPPGDFVNDDLIGLPLLNGPTEFTDKHPVPTQWTTKITKQAEAGSLLFCVRGSTGRMNWADQAYVIGRGLAAINHRTEQSLAPLVRGWIEHRLPELLAKATGSTFPNVSRTDIASIPILLPPIHEQKAIAHILGTLDDKIDQLRKTNTVLEDMASALFKSWFVDFDPVKAKVENRPTGLQKDLDDLFPDSFEDSALGPIPTGWRVSKTGDELTVVGGTTPSTSNPSYWDGGSHYWATPKDLSEQKLPIISSTSRLVTDQGLATISSRLLDPGSVLLSSRAPVGYLAVAEVPVAINQGFIAIKASLTTPTGFIYEWCKGNIEEFLKRSSGTTFLELSKSSFRQIPLVMPEADVVREYECHHTGLFKRVSSNIQQIRNLTNLRDTLLPKLISGDLRVPEAEQMVAELGL